MACWRARKVLGSDLYEIFYMDRITKSLLQQFVADNHLEALPEDRAFEHFCGYLSTGKHYADTFSSDDISVGSGGDAGIDSIALIVNGSLDTEPQEVNDLAESNGFLDVSFIFVQAERSSGFETAKIGQFSFGVTDFLAERPQLPQNERVAHYSQIAKRIFETSRLFKKGNPQCFLYYMTTGKWVGDANLTTRRDAARRDVEGLGLFRNVSFDCLGADDIQRLFRESQNAIATEIVFSKRVVIPEMQGVEEAYLGVLPATEFLKLVETESGEIRSSLFYDNVRHWQDWNPVNTEMKATLDDAVLQKYFPLLNNGVTVVAKRVNPTGDKFLIEDYQVVNGCQTSYVLHGCRQELDETIFIPVRLIATTNEDVRNAIIKATNRQTQVTDDQLFALAEFPKKLETYFPSFATDRKLYYERRSRQYSGVDGIEKVRVITMTVLVRAFASMFRELPHKTTRNYKALLRETGKEIFGHDHRVEPYYTAALAHYRLEYLFRNSHLRAELKPARYHILLAARILWDANPLPKMNSHEMGRYCDNFNELLWNDEKAKDLILTAAKVVEQVAQGNFYRDYIHTETFNQALKAALQQSIQPVIPTPVANPTIGATGSPPSAAT